MSTIKKEAGETPAKKSPVSAARGGRARRGGGRKASSPRSGKTRGARGQAKRKDQRKVVKIGLHFGDSKTRVAGSEGGGPLHLKRDVFSNIVGFLRLRAPRARISGKSNVLYAEQAEEFLQQVDLQKPILSGLVNDVRVCRQFITHVCSAIDPSGTGRIWGVASIPAVAGSQELEKAYRSLKGPLERVVVVPEPYLVAEGMRLDKAVQLERLGQDLTRGCIVIDVGAGTTDICLVRDGAFPSAGDQIRLEIAGNSIDHKIFTNALVHSPTLFLSRRMAREIKEEQAFVGGSSADATNVGSDLVALTEVIRKACDTLLEAIVEASCNLLGRCEPAAAAVISRCIILTGGGSQIRNLPAGLEQNLRDRGYQDARVLVPEDYKTLVARGALRFAQKLSDEEWVALASKSPTEIARIFSGIPDAAGAASRNRELDSLVKMDVKLRSEAHPSVEWDPIPEPDTVTESAPPAESDPLATPEPGPRIPGRRAFPTERPAHKKREEKPASVELEELDFFKAR